MSWYKKAQQQIGINSITWAIDELWLTSGLITEEDLTNAFSHNLLREELISEENNSSAIPKAAQTAISPPKSYKSKRKVDNSFRFDSRVLGLFERGYSRPQIVTETGIPRDTVDEIIRRNFPSKQEEIEYLDTTYKQKILDFIESRRGDIELIINVNTISESLGGIETKLINNILKRNNINLHDFTLERKFAIEDKIVDFIKSSNEFKNVAEASRAFRERTGHNIRDDTIRSALYFRNIAVKKSKQNTSLIFKAFMKFLYDNINTKTDMSKLIQSGKILDLANRFVERYGEYYGFKLPPEKDMIKQLLMMKIQLRDRATGYQEMGKDKFYNKFVPINMNQKIIELIQSGKQPEEIAKELKINVNKIRAFYQIYNIRHSPMEYGPKEPSYFLREDNIEKGNQNELV